MARAKRQPARSGGRQGDAVPRWGNGLQSQRARQAAPARQQPVGSVGAVGRVLGRVRGAARRLTHAHATPALSFTPIARAYAIPPPCSNIACNCEQTQKAIVAENALPALADLLHPDSGCSGGCREAAAWALSNLACSSDVRNELG